MTPDPVEHGFVLVGKDVIYASHMPRFSAPCDYQIVCEVELDSDAYRSLQVKYGTFAQFTVHTGPLSLHDLEPGNDGRPTIASIHGQLFLGRFDRDGDPLGEVTLAVRRTLAFLQLGKAKQELGSYLVFGREPDLFLAHRIVDPPDFDQILRVQRADPIGTAPAVDRGAQLVVMPAPTDELENRLLPGQHVDAVLTDGGTMLLQVQAELYLETEDLIA